MAAGSIVIDLLMKTGSFETDTKRAEKRLQAMQKQVERTGKMIGTAIAAGAVAAVAGLALMVNSQRQAIDEQAKLAQRLNTTYESLANLGRAGELAGVGMGQIEAASRQLDINIGRAIQGVKTQADAFDRLGISARDLASLPLDERIATINKALRDNVSAAERSAVAAEIFGAKNAAAIQMLDGATIADAARQVEIFGLNLSDVDAAKVEMANDAMSTFGMLTDGVGKQLTVQLAPILKAIGDEFLASAEEAGGLGGVVERTVERAVNGLAFVLDAIDGVRRTFQLAGRAIAVGALAVQRAFLGIADAVITGPTAAINDLINLMNRMPGINISTVGISRLGANIRGQMAEVEAAMRAGVEDIAEVAMAPLAGDALRRAFASAQAAGQMAAEAAVAGRRANQVAGEAAEQTAVCAGRATKAVKEQVDTVQRQIDSLFRQAETFNMSATQAKLYELGLDGATAAQLRQAGALLGSIDAMKAMQEEQERLNALLDATPTAQLEKTREDMLLLRDAFIATDISAAEFVEAAQTRLGTLPETTQKATDAMTTFSEQAARNMQDAFANFLFDPFDGGVRGMVSNFVTAIHRMASELLASQLLNMLGNSLAGSGGFLGAFGAALKGLSGARADGGPVGAGRTYLVGERGPELFTPNTAGAIVPNSALGGGGDQGGREINLRQFVVFKEEQIGDYMGSASGEHHLRTFVERNASFIAQAVRV